MMLALALVIAFLWGSVPWSWFIAYLSRGIDLRREGSGNVGATNVLRTCGRVPGALAYLLDGAKGYLGVFFLTRLFPFPALNTTLYGCMVMALVMLGHIFTPFLGFKGGKGAMAGVGGAVALAPWIGLATLGVFLIFIAATRIVSVATLTAAAAYPVLILLYGLLIGPGVDYILLGCGVAAALIVILAHRSNLKRLREGSERPPLAEDAPRPD